jgi:hypothetical protein
MNLIFKMFLAISLFAVQASTAQDCKTLAANKPATYSANYQSFSNTVSSAKPASWNISKIKPQLAKVENWMKNIRTGFTGAKLMYGNNYFLDPLDFRNEDLEGDHSTASTTLFYQATGIKGYSEGKMMFFAYYCYDNKNTVYKEDESGSNLRVIFNNVFASGLTSDAGIYSINGKRAFKIIKKKYSEGRIDFYELRSQDNATATMYTSNDYIILRNSDNPVFIPCTRKEYLQQMLINVDKSTNSDTKFFNESYSQNVKQFEAEMKIYKEKDKSYTPEKEAKRRKWFEEDQEKLKKIINKINPNTEAAKAIILQYLKKADTWLNKGFNYFFPNSYTAGNLTQYLESIDKSYANGEEETLTEIVSINPAYFNNNLGADASQLITVQLQNSTYAHMKKVASLVKQPGALAPLEAILYQGK